MKSEYSFVRHTSSTTTTRPASPATSSTRRPAAESVRPPCRVGYTIATAAPISSPNARVSVPSYTRVGSYPGWKSTAISIADAAASTSATPAIAHRARLLRKSFPPAWPAAAAGAEAAAAAPRSALPPTCAPGPCRRTRRRFTIHPASSTIASTAHGHTR